MGLATIDPHSHKVLTKFYKIPKFDVNRPNSKQDTAIWNFKIYKEMYGYPDERRWYQMGISYANQIVKELPSTFLSPNDFESKYHTKVCPLKLYGTPSIPLNCKEQESFTTAFWKSRKPSCRLTYQKLVEANCNHKISSREKWTKVFPEVRDLIWHDEYMTINVPKAPSWSNFNLDSFTKLWQQMFP